jgi:protein-L-isoaspartate(D-aspartate) O-methyltransferase
VSRRAQRRDELMAAYQDRFIDMLRMHHALEGEGLEDAFRATPRHRFVHHYLDASRHKPRMVKVDPRRPSVAQLARIYSNEALTTHRAPSLLSTISQPSLVGQMLGYLQLKAGMDVVEVGAGTGWVAALIGRLVGPTGSVTSLDLHAPVARAARRVVAAAGPGNVTVVTGDGALGYPKTAPFDRIVTSVGTPEVFGTWMDQLKEGGALLLPLQAIPHGQFCLLAALWKSGEHLAGDVVGPAWFIPLEGGRGRNDESDSQARELFKRASCVRRGRRHLAPWACMHPGARPAYRASLLFMAYLEGMRIERDEKSVLVASQQSEGLCLLEDGHVQVLGDEAAYDEFISVSRQWLALGAPGAQAYRVEVWPKRARKRRPQNGWLVGRDQSLLLFNLKK